MKNWSRLGLLPVQFLPRQPGFWVRVKTDFPDFQIRNLDRTLQSMAWRSANLQVINPDATHPPPMTSVPPPNITRSAPQHHPLPPELIWKKDGNPRPDSIKWEKVISGFIMWKLMDNIQFEEKNISPNSNPVCSHRRQKSFHVINREISFSEMNWISSMCFHWIKLFLTELNSVHNLNLISNNRRHLHVMMLKAACAWVYLHLSNNNSAGSCCCLF